MNAIIDSVWLVIALPLAGAVGLHFGGRRLGEPMAGYVATALIGAAFAVAAIAAVPFIQGGEQATHIMLWEWMPSLGANLEIQWDSLSALMTLIVTGVGTLIHLYSVGYMHGDERFHRFFVDLNLFAASMLTLVLAGNFAMLFLGWELVGLCSYLLVSFWYTRPSAAAAGKKAFIVNRIGDVGFMVGLMVVFASFGTLSYTGVLDRAGDVLSTGTATAVGLLFLVGAAGKSAQIPLYVWLPDAMEGPTPVSALIHAATMVTAGVYVIARSAPIYTLAPTAGMVVATVGALTAIWAASIAIAQNDIKKVLAYSTISQLGYMFIAVGIGAYTAAMFHLMTHAFFKGLLFLGSGSVIHAMDDEQDMRKLGGLFRAMPVTALTMLIGTLAISGIVPLAGFWSKDEILASAFGMGGYGYALWLVGLIAALLTAFYMTRQWVMVFLGESRWEDGVHPHESPRSMTVPLLVLAVLSLVGGLVNTPFRFTLEHFLAPAFEGISQIHPPEGWTSFLILAGLSLLAAVIGVASGYLVYRRPTESWARFQDQLGGLWTQWENAYNIDDLYGALLVAPGKRATEVAAFTFDTRVIDGAATGVAALVRRIGGAIQPLQSGFVRNYAALFLIGTVAVVAWLVIGVWF